MSDQLGDSSDSIDFAELSARWPQCLFIVGPTATGKSELAFELAKKLDCPILNLDSVQVHKRLVIGSALPPAWQMQEVEHQLFAFVEPGEELTAGDFRRLALNQLEKNFSGGFRQTILVGGSGFYIRALLKGMYDLAPVPEKIRAQVQSMGRDQALQKLTEIDPMAAKSINANDEYRIKRALEIGLSEGVPMAEVQKKFSQGENQFPYSYQLLGLNAPRPQLRERVSERAKKMLEQGLLDETKALLDSGYSGWRPLGSVGYRECVEFLTASASDSISREELAEKITNSTMKLIKKQSTFFRGQLDVQWLEAPSSLDQLVARISQTEL